MTCISVTMVFFFQDKTAYDMRICDWSSDVCSSYLNVVNSPHVPQMIDILYERLQRRGYLRRDVARMVNRDRNIFGSLLLKMGLGDAMITGTTRSEERSVGKESVSTCRYRWLPLVYQKEKLIK